MSDGKLHRYEARISWTCGPDGPPAAYEAYSRDHRVAVPGKPAIEASADPAFRGDPARHNPEDLLVAALSSCHMLWYLHLATVKGVRVLAYEDAAYGVMTEARPGRFLEAVLRPRVTLARGGDIALAVTLHERAHAECFIANSVNFPVRCEPVIAEADA